MPILRHFTAFLKNFKVKKFSFWYEVRKWTFLRPKPLAIMTENFSWPMKASPVACSITIHQRHWVTPELDLRNWIYVAITDTWTYCLVTPELDLCCNNWHISILPCTSVRPLFLPSLASSRFSQKCKSLQPVTDPPNPPKPPRCGSITWLDCGTAALKKGFLGKE